MGCTLTGSSFTHQSLPQGGNFLKTTDFTRSFQRNVHLWKMMKHGQSNMINWITISCKLRENTLGHQTTSYSAKFLLTEIFHSYIVKYCCCSFTRRWRKSTMQASMRLLRKRDLETLIHCMYLSTDILLRMVYLLQLSSSWDQAFKWRMLRSKAL